MSRLEELIQEYCPNGVEYRKISELTSYEQPSKYIVSSTDYDDSYKIPVLTAGQSFILGYTNEENGIYDASQKSPVIIFDDFTGAFKWVDFPFKVKSSAMKMIKANEELTTLRYLFHCMGFLNYSSSEHKRLWLSIYSEFEVPLPALPVQREIVRILDEFSLLSAELAAELAARKQQYNYYLNAILESGTNYKKYKLAEIATLFRGDYITKKTYPEGDVPVILGGVEPAYFIDRSNHDSEVVTVSRSGASAGFVTYWNEPIFLTDCFGFEAKNNVSNKFLYYSLKRIEDSLNKMKRGAGVPHVSGSVLLDITFRIPSYDEQNIIVDKIEFFEKICEDLHSGLPAEIEARQKQYEYYRNKLLSFKRLEA